MEIEFKYVLPSGMSYREIFYNDDIAKDKIEGTDIIFNMHAFYYDTEDFDLRKKHLTFRVRMENENAVCTIKYGGGSKSGLHRREEINIDVEPSFIENPSIEILKDYDIYPEYFNATNGKKLIPVVTMEYIRDQFDIKTGDSISVISYDQGKIFGNKKETIINELEVELHSGYEKDLIEFCDSLCEKFDLSPLDDSKLKRGIKLYEENK